MSGLFHFPCDLPCPRQLLNAGLNDPIVNDQFTPENGGFGRQGECIQNIEGAICCLMKYLIERHLSQIAAHIKSYIDRLQWQDNTCLFQPGNQSKSIAILIRLESFFATGR